MDGSDTTPSGGKHALLVAVLSLMGAVAAAVIVGGMSYLGTQASNSQLQRSDHQQYQSDLVMRALEPDDVEEREAQLRFLLDTHLLTDKEIREGLITYLEGSEELPQFGQGCHPSYEPCVPIAPDVDCAGGTTDGPVFIGHEVRVLGEDVYRLDVDGDGIGCEGAADLPEATLTPGG